MHVHNVIMCALEEKLFMDITNTEMLAEVPRKTKVRTSSLLPKRHWTVELVLVDQPDQAFDERHCSKKEIKEAIEKGLTDLSAGLGYKYLTVKRAPQEDKQ